MADGTEHPWASSNTDYGQDTHCHVRKGAEVCYQEKKTHSEEGRTKEKVCTGVQIRNKAMKRIGLHRKTEEQLHWPKIEQDRKDMISGN